MECGLRRPCLVLFLLLLLSIWGRQSFAWEQFYEATITEERALVYSDQALKIPIGFLPKWKRITINLLEPLSSYDKNRLHAFPVAVIAQEKIYYMNGIDLLISDPRMEIELKQQQKESKSDTNKIGNIATKDDEIEVKDPRDFYRKRYPITDEDIERGLILKRAFGVDYRLFSLGGLKNAVPTSRTSNWGSIFSLYGDIWPAPTSDGGFAYDLAAGIFYLTDANEESSAPGVISRLRSKYSKMRLFDLYWSVAVLYSPLLRVYQYGSEDPLKAHMGGGEFMVSGEWNFRRSLSLEMGVGFLYLFANALASNQERMTGKSKRDWRNRSLELLLAFRWYY